MDELKLRLEYLEQISKPAEQDSEESLLKTVDAIGDNLQELLGKNEDEFNRRAANVASGTEPSNPDEPPLEVQKQSILARNEQLKSMVSSIDDLDFSIPPPPSQETAEVAQRMVEKANALGKEFDELTLRSTELTNKLLSQIASENAAVAMNNDDRA